MTARRSPPASPPVRRLCGLRAVPLAFLTAAFVGAPLVAQYTSPGTAASAADIPSQEALEGKVNDSTWKLGSIRLSPWLGVSDAAFVRTDATAQASRADDFTVTAGAGLRTYLPMGKMIWTAHALPEYVWWQNDDAKSRLNGRFGLGLFGFFNRLTLEASLRRVEQQTFFSDEIQELTSSRSDVTRLGAEAAVARRLTVYAIAERQDLANQEETSGVFPLLDRETERVTTGVRYRAPSGWTLGLGYEDSSTTFAAGARNLSHSGSSELVDFGKEGSRFNLRLALALRHLEADEGSDYGVLNTSTGSLEALWTASSKLALLGYAQRRQAFSVDSRNAFSLEPRTGVRIEYGFAKGSLGGFAEIGEDRYQAVDTGAVDRLDDVTVYGLEGRMAIGRLTQVTVRLIQTRYDSNFDAFDRDVTDLRFSLELKALVEKLGLGQSGGDW